MRRDKRQLLSDEWELGAVCLFWKDAYDNACKRTTQAGVADRTSSGCAWLQIFPKMKNYTPYNRATSVGNQLLNNYRKFLLNYEICHRSRDLGGPIATPSAVTEVSWIASLAGDWGICWIIPAV